MPIQQRLCCASMAGPFVKDGQLQLCTLLQKMVDKDVRWMRRFGPHYMLMSFQFRGIRSRRVCIDSIHMSISAW
eukprot:272146-Amphidinium_carterae.1